MNRYFILWWIFSCILVSCNSGAGTTDEPDNIGRTPVTLTHIDIGTLEEQVELNATSSFLLKTPLKANTNGYLKEVFVKTGESVVKGQKLFIIHTKEAEHLGNTLNTIDTSLNFKGKLTVYSPENGYIIQLNHVNGDYVQDGETIATISSKNSLVFLLEIPFELKPFVPLNKSVEVILADGRSFKSNLSSPMPTVDPTSQTQEYMLAVPYNLLLPENLIAKVKFTKKRKDNTVFLPKDAVLTNETQSEYWIMKAIDSTTAIKIAIKKGLETSDQVEILAPSFNPKDNILLTGNYGLPDTASIVIETDTP